MKDIIKKAIIETNFYDTIEKTNYSKVYTFENLDLSKTENAFIRKNHKITSNEEILLLFRSNKITEGDFFTAKRVYNYSLVFLENEMKFFKIIETEGWDKEDDYFAEIPYSAIEHIEIFQSCVRFFWYDTNDHFDLGSIYFGLEQINFMEPLNSFFQKIKEGITITNNDLEQSKENYQEAINKAFDEEDYEKASNILAEYSFLENYYSYKFDLAFTLSMLDDDDKSMEVIEELIKTAEEENIKYWVAKAKMFKSQYIGYKGDYYGALQLFNEGLKDYEEKGSNGFYSEEKSEELYQKYLNIFNDLPYKDRKVIYITNSKEKFKSDSLTVLESNNLPKINFPAHHPINNETYVGHPFNNTLYIPIQNYDNELLIDRINEFCYLLQCLGAESIIIENVNSNNISNSINTQTDTNINASSLKIGTEIDYKNIQKSSSENQINLRIGKNQTFKPVKHPYVPNDLTWLSNEVGWQRLIKQRLEGNLLEHNELIDSSQSQILNTNEINDLKVDLKLFLAKANVNVKKDIDLEIKNNVTSQWRVTVKFKPIEQFEIEVTETNFIEISDPNKQKEVEFIDEYNFLKADGDLSERDLKILERLRIRLGITEERSVELIKSLNSYTEEEKELVEEIKFMLEDGEISERDQKILLRLSNKLNISEDRCIELINELL